MPRQCSPGAVHRSSKHTSRLCPGISDLPLAFLAPCRSRTQAVLPCKLDLTLVPTGPSLGLFPPLLLPRHWGGPGAAPGPTTLSSFGAGTESRSPCTLLCCASAAHLLRRPGIIKRDRCLFYSSYRCGLSLGCSRCWAVLLEAGHLCPSPHQARFSVVFLGCSIPQKVLAARSLFWQLQALKGLHVMLVLRGPGSRLKINVNPVILSALTLWHFPLMYLHPFTAGQHPHSSFLLLCI